jgi:hypothetical protein
VRVNVYSNATNGDDIERLIILRHAAGYTFYLALN